MKDFAAIWRHLFFFIQIHVEPVERRRALKEEKR